MALSVPARPLPALVGDARPILAVSQHTALRSPDFPPPGKTGERSPDLLAHFQYAESIRWNQGRERIGIFPLGCNRPEPSERAPIPEMPSVFRREHSLLSLRTGQAPDKGASSTFDLMKNVTFARLSRNRSACQNLDHAITKRRNREARPSAAWESRPAFLSFP